MRALRFLSSFFLFLAPLGALAFSDVPAGHPFATAIEYAEEEGIVKGYTDGTYRPAQSINRAEFVKILLTATSSETSLSTCVAGSKSLFPDVPKTAWFAPAVCLAQRSGIVGGYADGTFRPERTLNFAEAAKILVRAFGLDVSASSGEWWKPYIEALKSQKALPSTYVSADRDVNRGEMAEMIYRLMVQTSSGNVSTNIQGLRLIDIASLLKAQKITTAGKEILAFTADSSGEHTAVVLTDGKGNFTVYKDGKSMRTGKEEHLTDPVIFRFTEDGHLLHSVSPISLYVDERKITSSANAYSYRVGIDAVTEEDGIITYPETHSIREFDASTAKSRVLYAHPGKDVQYMRRVGDDVFYTLGEGQTSSLYKNGEKFSTIPVSNAWNFFVSGEGDAYFYHNADGRYTLYKNTEVFFEGSGIGGYIFEDAAGTIWHVSYRTIGQSGELQVFIYKGKEKVTDTSLANIEGYIAFSKKDHGRYAVRVAESADPQSFLLLKDGKIIGSHFTFTERPDFLGPLYASNGKVYMRNFERGRWYFYEDGHVILGSMFQDVWHFAEQDGKVSVYGVGR